MRRISTPILLLTLAVASGCGTLGGWNQRVKLATNPDGALVIDEEEDEELGETNEYFELGRSSSTSLILARSGYQTQKLELDASYRWGESFAANLFLLVTGPWGPPVGWALDFLTGAAWEYDELDPVKLEPIHPGYAVKGSSRPRVVAVTPPVADFGLLSEEVGDKLAAHFAETHPEDHVLELEETGDVFTAYGWDHETHIEEEFSDALADELDATHILESVVEETGDRLLVTVALYNVFTEEVEESYQLEYAADEIESSQHGWFVRTLLSAVTIIPNSVALDVRTPTAIVDGRYPRHTGEEGGYPGELEPVNPWLVLLAGLRVRNVRSSVARSNFGVGFELAPLVGLFWDRFNFDTPDHIEDGPPRSTFDWYGLTLGFGPELGLESPIGYFYLGLYPQWGVHATHGSFTGQRKETLWHTMWQMETELGWLFFITRNFHVRLFGRGIVIPETFWERTLARAGRDDISVVSATYLIAGLSFGYYSPTIRNLTKRSLL